MEVAASIKKLGLEKAFQYLYKDPEKNLLKIMDWADRFAGDEFESQRKLIREIVTDSKHPYHSFVERVIHEVDPYVMQTTAVNFFLNV